MGRVGAGKVEAVNTPKPVYQQLHVDARFGAPNWQLFAAVGSRTATSSICRLASFSKTPRSIGPPATLSNYWRSFIETQSERNATNTCDSIRSAR